MYTATLKERDDSDLFQLDGMIELLSAADQFLMPVLMAFVEVRLAELTNIKNVAEVLRVSCAFNANQIKRFCLELICENLAFVLENR